jgi:hypothetical protein
VVGIFNDAAAFNKDIGKWNVGSVTTLLMEFVPVICTAAAQGGTDVV